MKVLFNLTLFFVGLSIVAADLAGECDMVGFYTELGCTPVPKDGGCPDAFTCPDQELDMGKCYYRGISYSDGAPIPQDQIMNSCSRACSCVARTGLLPEIECAAVDCVEETPDIDCVKVYTLDSCCPVDNVCGKDNIQSLGTCDVDGEIYKGGQTYQPKNTRKTCLCSPKCGPDGCTSTTNCVDLDCGLELHYQSKIMKKCAPVFSGNDRGCPYTFQCPSSNLKIVKGINVRGVSARCTFGNQTLAVGDEVIGEKCVKCSCSVPPYVSCTSQRSC